MPLLFKVDENLPVEVAEMLRTAGHDAMTILDQDMSGWKDPHIAEICQAEARILVSLDTDFADVRAYPPDAYPGIVVLRLKRQDKPTLLAAFTRAMRIFPFEAISGRLWVVEEERVRIRGGS